jgi:predicted nuclease with TOPRIM domain
MLKTVEQKQIEINDLRKKIEQLITDNSQLE